jgi:hypothetical protein
MSITEHGRHSSPDEVDRNVTGRSAANALALGVLAGVGCLAVLTVGLWLTQDDTESSWVSSLSLVVMFVLAAVSVRQLQTWHRLRASPIAGGRFALVLLGVGLASMFVIVPILSVLGAPEWVLGEAGLIAIVALIVAGTIGLLSHLGRRKQGPPPPGAGTAYSERVLQSVTDEPGALRPDPDEEAVLEQAIADQYAFLSRSGGALLGLPTVVRQTQLGLNLSQQDALALAQRVLAQASAHIVGSWVEPDRAMVRGWWQSGPRIIGCPVVVSIALAAEGPGATHIAVRTASKVFLLNRHIPERTMQWVTTALTTPPASPTAVG